MPSKYESGGRKRHQNGKMTAKSAATQIRMKKVWWQKVPSKCKSGGRKRHQNCKMVAKSATTFEMWWNFNHHISYIGCRCSCQDEKDVNAYGVYIFSGKGPTFSASCKTYKHNF